MSDVNRVFLVGRLGRDPERRQTKNGIAMVNFPLATSRKLPERQEGAEASVEREETEWHKVVVWGRQAEVCKQYLTKGETVLVEGAMRSHKYDGKDGQSRTAFEVHADSVSFLGGKRRRSAAVSSESSGEAVAASAEAPVELAASA